MANVGYFINKLSPETRVLIYGFVFGDSPYVKRPVSHKKRFSAQEATRYTPHQVQTLIHTSTFAVSKLISAEALETFYNVKTVRLTVPQLYAALWRADFTELARNVQLIDCISSPSPATLHYVLRNTSHLPRINLLTVASDCLAWVPAKKSNMTVREFAEEAMLGDVTCVDVGRYKLHAMDGRIDFVHTKLSRMWPKVQKTPDDFDAFQVAVGLLKGWDLVGNLQNQMAWVSQTSLQLWVGLRQACIDHCRKACDDGIMPPVNPLHTAFMQTMKRHALMPPFVVVECPLRKLGPGDNSDDLEWATEFLALNDDKAHWHELEGGEPRGLLQAREYQRAKVEFHAQNFINHPTEATCSWRVEDVREWIAEWRHRGIQIEQGQDSDTVAVRDEFYVLAAVGVLKINSPSIAIIHPVEKARYDTWATDHLKHWIQRHSHYLDSLADQDLFPAQDIGNATYPQLRNMFSMVMALMKILASTHDHDQAANEGEDEVQDDGTTRVSTEGGGLDNKEAATFGTQAAEYTAARASGATDDHLQSTGDSDDGQHAQEDLEEEETRFGTEDIDSVFRGRVWRTLNSWTRG